MWSLNSDAIRVPCVTRQPLYHSNLLINTLFSEVETRCNIFLVLEVCIASAVLFFLSLSNIESEAASASNVRSLIDSSIEYQGPDASSTKPLVNKLRHYRNLRARGGMELFEWGRVNSIRQHAQSP